MNKGLVGAGVVVLAVAATAPYAVGYFTEQEWQKATSEINSSQALFQITTDDYQRGYMGADLRGTVVFINPDSGEETVLQYKADVSHGVTGSLMDFSSPDFDGTGYLEAFPNEKPRLTLQTRVWGQAVVALDVPATEFVDEANGQTISSSSLTSKLTIKDAGAAADLAMSWPGLTVQGPALQMQIANLDMEQSYQRLRGEVWTGEGVMTLSRVALSAPSQPTFSLADLSVTSLSEAGDSGETLDAESTITVNSVSVEGAEFGPHQVVFRFTDLNIDKLDAFSRVINDMQTVGMDPTMDPNMAMQQQMEMVGKMTEAMLALALDGFSAGIPTLDISTPQGPIKGMLMVSHPKLNEDQKSQTFMVLENLTGDLELSVPAVLVQQNPMLSQQVGPLVQQGMIVQDGDLLRVQGRLEGMVFNINGNEIPLPPMF